MSPRKESWTPRPYPPEFCRRAVELARLREKPVTGIAADLGIARSALHRWLRQADIDDGRKEGLTNEERAEDVLPPHVRRNLPEPVLRDVRESGRCLVYGLPAASGFQMMRATEAVAHAYYLEVCNPEPTPEKGKTLGFYIDTLRNADDPHAHEIAEPPNQTREKHRNDIVHPNMLLEADEAFTLFAIAKSAVIAMADRLDATPSPPFAGLPAP